jgi:hypothetical protein
MSNNWSTLLLRIRPDQKIALEEIHPDGIAPFMRRLIDNYLDSCKPDDVLLQELDKQIEEYGSKLTALKTQREQLIKTLDKRKSSLEFETLRNDYLKDNPRTLLDFSRNMVTTAGYDTIRYKLRFNSVKEVKSWLTEKLIEAKKSPDWEKHLTDRVNEKNALKCFSQTMHKPAAVLPVKSINKIKHFR